MTRGGAPGRLRRALSDRLLGPGATPADVWLALASAASAAALLPALAWWRGAEWTAVQWVVAAALAGDLVGGVVVNASAPARRYYFRAGRTRRDHLAFVALHVAHVLLFAWLFGAGDWRLAATLSAGLLLSAALIRTVPPHLRRQVAMLCLVVGVAGSTAGGATPGMEWFVPVLLLKLLVCYLLGDVPAAPAPPASAHPAAAHPATALRGARWSVE